MAETKTIAICGKKQSGKSSLCTFIQAALYEKYGRASYYQLTPKQNEDGSIEWLDYMGDIGHVLQSDLDKYSKVYNVADSLKQVCVDVLGVLPEQCYGTDAQKNILTNMKWENIPEYIRWAADGKKVHVLSTDAVLGTNTMPASLLHETFSGPPLNTFISLRDHPEDATDERQFTFARTQGWNPWSNKHGRMTGREVMQVFGTDVMRKMFFDNVWVNATMTRIKKDAPPVALIADMRFRSELQTIYPSGAYVVRLERNILNDSHASEVDFDGYNWSQHERSLVIPEKVCIHEKNRLTLDWLTNVVGLFQDTPEK